MRMQNYEHLIPKPTIYNYEQQQRSYNHPNLSRTKVTESSHKKIQHKSPQIIWNLKMLEFMVIHKKGRMEVHNNPLKLI